VEPHREFNRLWRICKVTRLIKLLQALGNVPEVVVAPMRLGVRSGQTIEPEQGITRSPHRLPKSDPPATVHNVHGFNLVPFQVIREKPHDHGGFYANEGQRAIHRGENQKPAI
jgi:hypothetical protein